MGGRVVGAEVSVDDVDGDDDDGETVSSSQFMLRHVR